MSPKPARSIELTLPDLPEVPISLGPVAERGASGAVRMPWPDRLRDGLAAALPLIVMLLLAVGSWWLVRNAPQPLEARPAAAPRTEPDYTMTGFLVQRFAADGRLRVQIEGRELRHVPATGRLEVLGATLKAYSPEGQETVATAQRALSDDATTEVQLMGDARIRTRSATGRPAVMEGERLLLYPQERRVLSEQPVRLRLGDDVLDAARLDYREDSGVLDLAGPVRGVFAPRPSAASTGRP